MWLFFTNIYRRQWRGLFNGYQMCVCVCMCEQDNSKKCGPIWIKFSGSIDFGGGRNRLDFEDSPHGEVAPWANFRLYTFTYTVRRKARKYRHGNHYGEGGLSGLYRTLHPRGRLPRTHAGTFCRATKFGTISHYGAGGVVELPCWEFSFSLSLICVLMP